MKQSKPPNITHPEGCGSKHGTFNGTLVQGNKDNACVTCSCFLSHSQMAAPALRVPFDWLKRKPKGKLKPFGGVNLKKTHSNFHLLRPPGTNNYNICPVVKSNSCETRWNNLILRQRQTPRFTGLRSAKSLTFSGLNGNCH